MLVDLTTEAAHKLMHLTMKLSEAVEEHEDIDPKIVVTALLNKMTFAAAHSELTTLEFEHYLMFALKSFDDLRAVKEKMDEVAAD
jgi:hypothetical protein